MCGEAWVKSRAVAAYGALCEVLAAGGGPFFFGAKPTALDAAVFGHLHAVRGQAAAPWVPAPLAEFYARVRAAYFAEPAPLLGGSAPQCALEPAEGAQLGSGVGGGGDGGGSGGGGGAQSDAEKAANVVATVAIFVAVVVIGQALVRGRK
jgi:hypothetical protein